MLRNLLITIVGLLLSFTSVYASEVTGSINTSNSLSTGLQMSIPCNPAAVSNGTVNATTCAITCNSGFTLSGLACVALSTGGGGGGGGGSSISIFATGSTNTGSTSSGTTSSGTTGLPNTNTGTTGSTTVNITPVARDIANHWAKAYIDILIRRGIVQNALMFRPEDSLTRAEFLKIIGNAAKWDLASTSTGVNRFTDVASDAWYLPYTKYAVAKGVIQGTTTFRPDDTITRAEVSKILSISLDLPLSSYAGTFSDTPRFHTLVLYVESMKRASIFEGQARWGGFIFRPNDSITRAEIAKVVVRAFNIQ